MNPVIKTMTLSAAAFVAVAYSLSADPVETALDEIFGQIEESVPGKFGINYRIRFEETNNVGGISQRIRYGYTTENYNGFTASIEGETVDGIDDGFNGLDIAGEGTDLNQIWGAYKSADLGSVKVGRQVYTLDDQRFIGHVGWRQNIQTYDVATVAYNGVENLAVNAFYIGQINRINDTHIDMDGFGLNAGYAFSKALKVVGFYYDFDDSDLGLWDTETLGLRATGTCVLKILPSNTLSASLIKMLLVVSMVVTTQLISFRILWGDSWLGLRGSRARLPHAGCYGSQVPRLC